MKILTVSCLGLGMRGDVYLSLLSKKENFRIVSICDRSQMRLLNFKNKFLIEEKNAFTNDKGFFLKKRSDILLICTQDKDHIKNLEDALIAGYKNIVVEKPFATTFEDIKFAEELVKKYQANVLVCHVLRYAPAFIRAKEYIDLGKIGELKCINATERVGLPHQSHSYVRGSYAIKEESSPMIMAKCCHDLDLLVWYTGSLCSSLSSIGSLSYFIKNNQPKGASDRCDTCKYRDKCFFSAEFLYNHYLKWAQESLTDVRPITEKAIHEALKTSMFGRCVFNGENNVVDNQIVMMKFKNGIEATLTMTAFTPSGGRVYIFYGTEGELKIDESEGIFFYRDKLGNKETIPISTLITASEGHGGGDKGLVDSLYEYFTSPKHHQLSSLEYSIESHKMALYAEGSRLLDGKKIDIH